MLPAGAPRPQCLYAACRTRQLHTLIYLCNAGTEALVEVSVATNNIDMGLFFEARCGEEPWAEGLTGEQRWDVVPPGACVLIGSLSHVIRNRVARHRLAYTDAAGQRWTAEANDLDAACLTQDGD